ncbi:MAG: type IV-A pilus assembly ATPase PilB [Gammaproteobacteria bacterium]|nr:type IV-A pilus assembly ATPase PilB [Gammaproteobacteria bacterium]
MILSGLARQLVQQQYIAEEAAIEALTEAQKNKISFVQQVVNKKLVKAIDVAMLASKEFGIPVFDINVIHIEREVITLVNEKLINKHMALPVFQRGNKLFVAIADPTNVLGLDEIKFQSGINTEGILVEADKLGNAIERALAAADDSMSDFDDDGLGDLDFEDPDKEEVEEKGGDEAPIVKFINKMLMDAIKAGASDLHFEPYEKFYRVRFRIDGILQEVARPPVNLAGRISARVKVLSRLDISERRVPQDGRLKMRISKTKSIDFRVSTCPTLYGEKIVMRILDSDSAKLGIDMLGYDPEQKQHYLDNLAKPYGLILVTGPTGSGKTVSLYTGLNILNTEDRNISTAEDPSEIVLPGVNQVNVNPKTGLTFAKALKAFLRQDPDIIMVGEIRDIETGEIAIKAAQTGHLVLSTLHTNDAPQTLTRLMNMGIAPFNIATSVSLIIAQRLGRRLCEKCKTVADIPPETLIEQGFSEDEVDDLVIYQPVGCDACNDGFKGRVGIYQVMPISEEMGRIIMESANSMTIAEQAAKEGIPDLRQSALEKVRQGLISLEEAHRVTVE